ncbi:MAG: preprotein translocase subunit SecA, partial [Candidatus Parcubacteria bacterium]
MSFLDKFFGPSYQKELVAIAPLVAEINALESTYAALATEALPQELLTLRTQVEAGATLESVLPAAFALTREASKRTMGLRHFDVQL